MLHKLKDREAYCISSHNTWLSGAYDSPRAAKYAFRFSDTELYIINSVIHQITGLDRDITYEDLKLFRRTYKKCSNIELPEGIENHDLWAEDFRKKLL